jgi:uncharacterized membrane protein YcfT
MNLRWVVIEVNQRRIKMEWILTAGGFAIVCVVVERFANATPPDYKLFGIPIGKYDNDVAKFLGFLKQAIWPKK